jgi:hypothetical protein
VWCRAWGRRANRARGSGGASFGARRARRPVVVWPPPHRRDLQRISLPGIDPASRCSPTRPLERVRAATAIGYLQRDVFIKRRGLDWIPAVVYARRWHFISAFPAWGEAEARRRLDRSEKGQVRQAQIRMSGLRRMASVRAGKKPAKPDGRRLGTAAHNLELWANRSAGRGGALG